MKQQPNNESINQSPKSYHDQDDVPNKETSPSHGQSFEDKKWIDYVFGPCKLF